MLFLRKLLNQVNFKFKTINLTKKLKIYLNTLLEYSCPIIIDSIYIKLTIVTLFF